MDKKSKPSHNLPARAWFDLLVPWATVVTTGVFAAGMALVWAFALRTSPLLDSELDRGSKSVKGHVHPPVEPTGWSVGGRAGEGGSQIYRYYFSFDVDTRKYEGVCFSTGRKHEIGEADIEYLSDRPGVARIKGTRVGVMDRHTILVIFFPAITLLFLVLQLVRGWNALRMLAWGCIASGKILEAAPARSAAADRRGRWRITFEFLEPGGKAVKAKAETAYLVEPKPGDLLDVIHWPGKPARCRYVGDLVHPVAFDAAGNYESAISAEAWLRAGLFALFLGGNLIYGLWALPG